MNEYNFHLVSGCVYNAKNTIGRADINLSAVVPFCGFLPHMRKMSENIHKSSKTHSIQSKRMSVIIDRIHVNCEGKKLVQVNACTEIYH